MKIALNPMAGKTPCYKCKKRKVGCHAKCKSYQEWTKECLILKENVKLNNESTSKGWSYLRKHETK